MWHQYLSVFIESNGSVFNGCSNNAYYDTNIFVLFTYYQALSDACLFVGG